MKKLSLYFVAVCLIAVPQVATAGGQAELAAVSHLMDSARILEAHIFAPEAWKDAEKEYADAKTAVEEGKKNKTVQKHVGRAREYTENAIKASEVAKLSLSEYLEPRNKSRAVKAAMHVPELYAKAEMQFMKATEKVEKGDVKGGLKEAGKSTSLFGTSELEAIRTALLGTADNLIAKAEADEAEKYALATLDRARTSRAKADAIIVADRYERNESLKWIRKAEYEARHASNMAQSVRSLKRNDQAWEKLMLVYEIQMNRVGAAIGLEHLPFDNGPLAAADTLINYIKSSQQSNSQLRANHEDWEGRVGEQLRNSLARAGEVGGGLDVVDLARLVDERFALLLLERDDFESQVQTSEVRLAQVEREQAQMSEELSVRLERERKFKMAKTKIMPSEGQVLFNASNDVVLRLTGLSFDIGSSQITDEQMPLLNKVVEILSEFPDAELVIEGHTDASGDPGSNLQLSERRAYALMMYLRTATGMSSDRVRAIGYGSERPIATNATKAGRSKNRRNDIIIMQ